MFYNLSYVGDSNSPEKCFEITWDLKYSILQYNSGATQGKYLIEEIAQRKGHLTGWIQRKDSPP